MHIGKDIYYNSYPRCLPENRCTESVPAVKDTLSHKRKKRVSPHSYRLEGGEGAHGSRQGSSYYSIVATSQRRSRRPSRLAPHLGTVVFQNLRLPTPCNPVNLAIRVQNSQPTTGTHEINKSHRHCHHLSILLRYRPVLLQLWAVPVCA